MAIQFTQYMRPDGRAVNVTIDRSEETELQAKALIDAGFVFECEVLLTGEVSITCWVDEDIIAMEVSPNGPDILVAVDRVVSEAYDAWRAREPATP